MGNFVDLSGQRFGRLVVLQRAESLGTQTAWMCRCDCGNIKPVRSCTLLNGRTTSCGCFNKELASQRAKTHGKSKSRIYNIWCGMHTRCYNPKRKAYADYGGRGITICDEWKNDFQMFYDWAMANGYADNLTIDRVDVNRNYEPQNCKWSEAQRQANNRRSNLQIVYNGEGHTMAEWARISGIPYKTLHYRISCGWSIEKALSEKVKGS